MKLALIIYRYFPYGGLQRDFIRFIEVLRSRGHSIEVFCISWEGDRLEGITTHVIPIKAWSNHRRNQRFHEALAEQLPAQHFDLIIGFNKMPGLDVYYAGDSCYLDKALNERSKLYRLTPRFRHFAACEAAVFGGQSTTQILLISETEKARFLSHYATPEARLHLLPPGIDRQRFNPGPDSARIRQQLRHQLGCNENDHLLLFVGSGFIKKGLDRAITALASLPEKERQRSQLYVIGQDREKRYRQLASKLGLEQQVHFMGGRDDVPDFMQAADLMLHPALDEAAGIAILEAVVAGLPVLVTDICGYAHHIRLAGAGQVLDSPFQQAQLNVALRATLEDKERLLQWQQAALDYAARTDLYSMHSTGADIIEAIAAQGSR